MALGNVNDTELIGIEYGGGRGESPVFGLFLLVAASDLESEKEKEVKHESKEGKV